MADGEKRIVELTETQTFGNGDYLPLDNISNSETKKIEAKKLGITYTMTDTEDGFSFDGSNGYHYEKVIPKDAEMSYDDYDDLTEEEKMDGSNRFIPDYPDEEKEPEIWTRVGRTPLETDAKTISPAINELKGRIDDSDTEIEEVKSNLTELNNYIEVTLPSTATDLRVSYPTGYSQSNCYIVAFLVKDTSDIWRTGEGISAGDERIFFRLSDEDIIINNNNSGLFSRPIRVVLQKLGSDITPT